MLFSYQGKAETWYVDDDGGAEFEEIQDAVNASKEGDIIKVYEGTYQENVIVNKTISLMGNGSANTIINGGGVGDVVNLTGDWVNLTGFTITGSGKSRSGMIIESDNTHIAHVNSSGNNGSGIYLRFSNSTTIMSSTCASNTFHGIFLRASSNNTISNMDSMNNGMHGIWLSSSENNVITNTTSTNNKEDGIHLSSSSGNTISNVTCVSNHRGVFLTDSSNNIMSNVTCTDNRILGMYIRIGSMENTILRCTCEGNKNGIMLQDTSNNRIEQSLFTENREHGIILYDCDMNAIEDTIISQNAKRGIFFDWLGDDHNSFLNCTIDSNNWSSVVTGERNLFESCVFRNTNGSGLSIWVYGRYTRVANCSFINNTGYGIFVEYRKGDDWDPLIQEDNYFENNKRGKVKYQEHNPREYSLLELLCIPLCGLLILAPIVVIDAIHDIVDGRRRRKEWSYFLSRRSPPRYDSLYQPLDLQPQEQRKDQKSFAYPQCGSRTQYSIDEGDHYCWTCEEYLEKPQEKEELGQGEVQEDESNEEDK